MNQKVIEKFWNLLGKDRVLVDEPMKRHTTFRIGGPADFFLLPSTVDEVRGILEICREEELPYFILGNGSNLLVSDKGYRGVIIQLYRNFSNISVEGNEICASSGALLSQIAAAARNASLTGFEFAGGIPGTLGGAVCYECRCLRRRAEGCAEGSSCYDRAGRNPDTSCGKAGHGIQNQHGSKKPVIWFWRQDLFWNREIWIRSET